MAILAVNPTRMALMDLKRRSKSAQRGHKLLKDKQDGLMQAFLSTVRRAQELRKKVEEELGEAFHMFLLASAWIPENTMTNALSSPEARVKLDTETKSVMSVRIPIFQLQREGKVKTYGASHTNALLDKAVDRFEQVFDVLVQLAEIEKQAENMAIELEATRRRVNALEYNVIPNLKDTVKYITMKLDEAERAAIISTMRVKASIS
ncbi:V-type ATP synthase subunit D [Candidatus Peregrinibacteria bacterium CG10_big_fil_rev_8_21_14_0_10_49_16]|nr:MAG: V-type ATP synthase subunit D [Candidatus Peregrinibacteria bacterium CG22_combo_CG10-13_8_21_14_all_49_11]PIR52348.1 MAG: V-type ATP synthase subunit D [Candidatus Peregrinibacteria bacterium CG10_big_fil_rev_8_21_14_0_10_49_16]